MRAGRRLHPPDDAPWPGKTMRINEITERFRTGPRRRGRCGWKRSRAARDGIEGKGDKGLTPGTWDRPGGLDQLFCSSMSLDSSACLSTNLLAAHSW